MKTVAWPVDPPTWHASPERQLWRGLRYFEAARLVVAVGLCAYVPLLTTWLVVPPDFPVVLFQTVAWIYGALALAVLLLPRPVWLRPRMAAKLQMGLDVVLIAGLMHWAGGVASGLALLLFLPNAGAAILGSATTAMFYAVLSALVLLGDTVWRAARSMADPLLVQTSLMSAGLMVLVLVVQRLAGRLATQEHLAWQRGQAWRNQWAVTQMVMSELPEGVVVLGPEGHLSAMNPAAGAMLGGVADGEQAPPGWPALRAALLTDEPPGSGLPDRLTELSLNVQGERRRIRVRRLPAPHDGGDAVLVLEDLGQLEQRAQQLNLAAMGRLSASIAHEIRNPLAAIRHANGLLAERLHEPSLDRLARIVEDNCQRIDRIVEDVLAIARRHPASPEPLDAAVFLPQVLAEYAGQPTAGGHRIVWQAHACAPIWFDAGHLRQVLLNLVSNALRYASQAEGAVQIEWMVARAGRPCLVVSDDGPGVAPALQKHLFEPFFTTETRGTGLGLHLVREFCSANRAGIWYRPPTTTPRVRSAFVIEPVVAFEEP